MKDPLLLLPGMMCDARLFGPQIEGLDADIRVPAPTKAESMEALASEVLADAPPSFALGGLSMGGILAMEILRQAPDRVSRLALMDTNPFAEKEEIKTRRHLQMEKVRAGHLAQVMREEMKPNYLAESVGREDILDLCMSMALDLGPEVFIAQSLALRDRSDQSDTLRAFGGPTLILCGEHDLLCPVSRHKAMHDMMPHGILTIIEGAGHLPTLECPRETTMVLNQWLEGTPDG